MAPLGGTREPASAWRACCPGRGLPPEALHTAASLLARPGITRCPRDGLPGDQMLPKATPGLGGASREGALCPSLKCTRAVTPETSERD